MWKIADIFPYKRVPVLLYHRIAPAKAVDGCAHITVLPGTFESQMKYMQEQGYTTMSLDELIMNSGDDPGRRFVITFDDGYLDNYTTAFPILEAYGFTATFFLVTEFLGNCHAWDSSLHLPYMNWSQVSEMRDHGFSFGSHTCTHPDLTAIAARDIMQEITVSRRKLEDRLGIAIRHFSYPFGKYNQTVKECVGDAGYASACSVSASCNDDFSIERFGIAMGDGRLSFTIKASRWASWVRFMLSALREA